MLLSSSLFLKKTSNMTKRETWESHTEFNDEAFSFTAGMTELRATGRTERQHPISSLWPWPRICDSTGKTEVCPHNRDSVQSHSHSWWVLRERSERAVYTNLVQEYGLDLDSGFIHRKLQQDLHFHCLKRKMLWNIGKCKTTMLGFFPQNLSINYSLFFLKLLKEGSGLWEETKTIQEKKKLLFPLILFMKITHISSKHI